ncbi:MAG: DUF2577 domain-containing protein [Solibacillus sp.]|uniref:DUF2577 domain-containing protein n=1 Tax=Solibacillus sp. TaxID=1909654 RepID=UPI00331585C9
MNKHIVELASIIKNQSNQKPFEGFLVGTVESAPPNLKVRISPEILLQKENMIVAAHVLKDYEREFEIFEGDEIQLAGSSPVSFTAKGKLKWTNTLEVGDNVILVPAGNIQDYILIDKGVVL